MVIIILKTSCTPAPPPQPPISDSNNSTLSSSSLFDYHSRHHSNIQCDVSFLSTNNDNNFIVLRQSFRPCGIDNVLLLTHRHNDNGYDASRRYIDDDDGFSISLTNCQFDNNHDVDVSPSTVRLTYNNNNDKWIGSVRFDLSSIVNDDGIGGECHADNFTSTANNNNTTSHHSHYYNDKTSQLILQSIDEQMKMLQTAFAALGMFGLVLIVGFVYTARNSRKLTSSKKFKCERVNNHGVNEVVGDDNAMVSTESIESKSRKQTKDEIVIVKSSSSLHHSTVNESTGNSIAPSRDDLYGCGGRNEPCHETLHLISCQHENNKGEEEESSSSIRQWYDDLLSPRPTAAAAAAAAVTASGDTGLPLRTLFSNASSAKEGDDDAKNVVMTMPGGQLKSQQHDSCQLDTLVPVESSTQQLTSNNDDTANFQGGECSTLSAVVARTEKDYDRVENDKASQLHNNSRDPQDRLTVNDTFPTIDDSNNQTMSITKNQHGVVVVNCQEGESTAAAAAALLQGQTLLQDKSSQTNDCNIRIDCKELTPVTKNNHD
eukprot:scaffold121613_cov22-Cyclotella_meneghiniana.AAC.1